MSMAEYCCMSLNMPENAQINSSDYARVLSMSQYTYDNIIIVTNVTLECLPTKFLHPGTLLPFYRFLKQVRTQE